jgi:MFS family permease
MVRILLSHHFTFEVFMEESARSPLIADQRSFRENSGKNEAYSSGVSWSAVIAGAFVAASLSLILLALGAGAGLSSVSPWNAGSASSRLSFVAIIWLITTQIVASALGGYLAGRLRTKWVNIHTDEVYFRDTAHGFLVWAVGIVLTAAFLGSAGAAMVGSAPTGATGAQSEPHAYFVDRLLRSNPPRPEPTDNVVRAEVGRIFTHALGESNTAEDDKTYLASLVVAKTGLSRTEAEKRVSEVLEEAKQAADTARKAIAHSLYWLFLALLIGAFSASYAATVGGRQRDHVLVAGG